METKVAMAGSFNAVKNRSKDAFVILNAKYKIIIVGNTEISMPIATPFRSYKWAKTPTERKVKPSLASPNLKGKSGLFLQRKIDPSDCTVQRNAAVRHKICNGKTMGSHFSPQIKVTVGSARTANPPRAGNEQRATYFDVFKNPDMSLSLSSCTFDKAGKTTLPMGLANLSNIK